MLTEDLAFQTAVEPEQGLPAIRFERVQGSVSLKPSRTPSPVLIHVHIPKTAGTSLWRLLERAGESHRNLYVNDTYFVYTPGALAEFVSNTKITSISSHHIQTFPPYLGGRRMLYFTILRDPVQQFISYITFIKKVYKDQTDPNLLSCLPRDAASLSLKEVARWLLTQERAVPFHENYTVNFLARQTFLSLTGNPDPSAYRAVRLSLAKAVLDQFVFVALTERMEESVDTLRKICGGLGVELPAGPVGRENTSSELRDDLSWVDPTDDVGALLFQAIEEDRQLYDWARARFESHYWRSRLARSS